MNQQETQRFLKGGEGVVNDSIGVHGFIGCSLLCFLSLFLVAFDIVPLAYLNFMGPFLPLVASYLSLRRVALCILLGPYGCLSEMLFWTCFCELALSTLSYASITCVRRAAFKIQI